MEADGVVRERKTERPWGAALRHPADAGRAKPVFAEGKKA